MNARSASPTATGEPKALLNPSSIQSSFGWPRSLNPSVPTDTPLGRGRKFGGFAKKTWKAIRAGIGVHTQERG
jgi:hypothetical protein